MSKKKTTRKDHTFLVLALTLGGLLLLLAAILLTLRFVTGRPDDPAPAETETAAQTQQFIPDADAATSLGSGIRIADIGTFSGPYYEDGKNDPVDGVAAVTLVNEGTDEVQYMTFTVTMTDGAVYAFQATTLLPGDRMLVLAQGRAAYVRGAEIASSDVTAYARFAESPGLHADTVFIGAVNGQIRVRNLSDHEIKGGRVYYQNRENGTIMGGITYSLTFGDLGPGEERVLTPSRFREYGSTIRFVTYDD